MESMGRGLFVLAADSDIHHGQPLDYADLASQKPHVSLYRMPVYAETKRRFVTRSGRPGGGALRSGRVHTAPRGAPREQPYGAAPRRTTLQGLVLYGGRSLVLAARCHDGVYPPSSSAKSEPRSSAREYMTSSPSAVRGHSTSARSR